jgi:hypothetical protein
LSTVPSPSKVEDSLVSFVPEYLECWCVGQGEAPLPRQVLVAVGRERIYFFQGPIAQTDPLVTLDRGNVLVAHSGSRYGRNRLVFIERGAERRRSYTVSVWGLNGGRLRRVEHTVALLRA